MAARDQRAGKQASEGSSNNIGPVQGMHVARRPGPGRSSHDPHTLTVREFYETSYRPVRHAQAAKATLVCYRGTLKQLDEFAGRPVTLAMLDDELVERFIAWMIERVSPEKTNVRRAEILAIWRFAWKRGKVDDLPRDVMRVREPKHAAVAWTVDEMGRILRAARALGGDVDGIAAHLWWPALILTLYDTGLRIGAVMMLRPDAFDAPRQFLTVPHPSQKQNADQVLRLHAETVEAITAIEPAGRAWLFPWDVHRQYLYRRHIYDEYRLILKLAGLPTGKRDMFHKFRKTNATYFADATDEREAQRQLGHSSLSVTRRYIDVRMLTRTVHAADVLPRPTVPQRKGA